MKFHTSVELKMTNSIETNCSELGLKMQPSCTEDIFTEFNEFRSEMVLLQELNNCSTNSEYEGTSVSQQGGSLVLDKSRFAPSLFLTTTIRLADGASAAENLDKEQGGGQVAQASARGNSRGSDLFGVRHGQAGIGIGGQVREGLGQAADLVVSRNEDSHCATDGSQARDNKYQGERRSSGRVKIPIRRYV